MGNKKNIAGSLMIGYLLLIGGLLGLLVGISETSEAHVAEDSGESEQLYSYYIDNDNRPVLDGKFNSATGGGNAEWASAYVRTIRMENSNSSRSINATILFMNDAEYLYVGMTYRYENSGNNNNWVTLFFDEGNGAASNYDGDHDDRLTGTNSAPNENAVRCKKSSVTPTVTDLCWNGTSWITDGDSSTDVGAYVYGDIVSTQLTYEFKIPLNKKVDSSSSSDLNVNPSEELGIMIHARLQGQSISYTDYYWSMTNKDPNSYTANGTKTWGDLRLGVKRSDLTLHATYAIGGDPTVDGDITSDFSWADSYQRDMVLTNFNGSKMDAEIYIVENPDDTFIYFGVVIYDNKSSGGDSLTLFFEQNYTSLPAMDRDYILDHDCENALQVSKGDGFQDQLFTASGGVSDWSADTDTDNEDQQGKVRYYLKPNRYEFEFRLNYSAAKDGTNDEDLYLAKNALIGFHLQYHDDDAAGVADYFWEYTANNNATLIDKNNNVFLGIGFAYLQLGGPAIKLIAPQDQGTATGSGYTFQIMAVDENANGVKWCGFQVEGQTRWTSLIKKNNSNIWSCSWDTTTLNNGNYEITIVAKDDDGVVVRRYIEVTVYNKGTGIPPTMIKFDLDPTEQKPISGTSVDFIASCSKADGVKFYVDSTLMGDMSLSSSGDYEFNLNSELISDGVHSFRAVAYNTYGQSALSRSYTVDNWALAGNPIDDPKSAIFGNYTFTVRPNPPEDCEYTEFYIDGSLYGNDFILTSNTHQFPINTTILTDGNHVAKAVSYDPDGKFVISFLSFKTDNWHPDVSIISPRDGSKVSGETEITVSGSDLDIVYFYVDDELVMTSTEEGPWVLDLMTQNYPDGAHLIKVVGSGRDGNIVLNTTTLIFNNDKTGPSISIVSPRSGQDIFSDVVVLVVVTDESEIASVDLILDDDTTIPMSGRSGSSYYEYTLSIEALALGDHTLMAVAEDISNNSGQSAVISFTNALQDVDGDGVADVFDEDIDGDGIPNFKDTFPYDEFEFKDSDGDGIGDNADIDDDNDGWSDTEEETFGTDPFDKCSYPVDSDKDHVPDSVDTDDDNDGFIDTKDAFPKDPDEWSDLDEDGIGDNSDLDIDGDGFVNEEDEFPMDPLEWSDLDEDGIGDNSDPDMDGDGFVNDEDEFPLYPLEWSDLDRDGIGDNSDLDMDGDGVFNIHDKFPSDPSEWGDTDEDGIGDNSDTDKDGDGFVNDEDGFPMDPLEWSDLDGDGIGDNSDLDVDGDGVFNIQDLFPSDPSEWDDLDEDGIGDNSDPDRDGDGIHNSNDSFPDDPYEWSDLDNDGTGDNKDLDIDGDGVLNANDAFPFDASESLDTDNDGIGNNADTDDDNDGVKDDDDEAPLNPHIGPKDYKWLVLPITLVILTILVLAAIFFFMKYSLLEPKTSDEEEPRTSRTHMGRSERDVRKEEKDKDGSARELSKFRGKEPSQK